MRSCPETTAMVYPLFNTYRPSELALANKALTFTKLQLKIGCGCICEAFGVCHEVKCYKKVFQSEFCFGFPFVLLVGSFLLFGFSV